jgi:hypothetical protein
MAAEHLSLPLRARAWSVLSSIRSAKLTCTALADYSCTIAKAPCSVLDRVGSASQSHERSVLLKDRFCHD